MTERRPPVVNSSARHVFDILRLVARAEEPLGVSEIGRRLNLPGSTVYRALITLEESGYLGRYENSPRYELGNVPHFLNRALVHRFKLHGVSRPILRALAESIGETVTLTVRLGWYGLRLAGVYGSRDIYHRDRLGKVELLHRSLNGMGILAFLDDAEFGLYRNFVGTTHPAVDPADWAGIERHMAVARATGFAQDDGAGAGTAAAVSLPVRTPTGEVLGSLTVSGPVHAPDSAEAGSAWRDARDALEAQIAAAPDSFRSPFASIAAHSIVIGVGQEA